MHTQPNSLSDYAESFKLITFVVFLFWVIKELQVSMCEEMDISPRAVIPNLCLTASPNQEDM